MTTAFSCEGVYLRSADEDHFIRSHALLGPLYPRGDGADLVDVDSTDGVAAMEVDTVFPSEWC